MARQVNKENIGQSQQGDRFIPTRVHSSTYQLTDCAMNDSKTDDYQKLLEKSILRPIEGEKSNKVMDFSLAKGKPKGQIDLLTASAPIRTVKPRGGLGGMGKPIKTMSAPYLLNDFYLNPLDWSSDNYVAAALDATIYAWNYLTSTIYRLYEAPLEEEYICSVKFCPDQKIAFGNNLGQIKIFDLNKRRHITTFSTDYERIGSLDWHGGQLASGCIKGIVASWDLRCGRTNAYRGHQGEICGLKWSPDGNYLASGSNDDKLLIYSNKTSDALVVFQNHQSAVKAMDWCPTNPFLLASGGGTHDRRIRFYSTQTLKQTHSIDTGSQVCNLRFSTISNEMVTTHGYSLNQINLWETCENWEPKSVSNVSKFMGHTGRVLYLAGSPSGELVLTGAADETLRFWNVFGKRRGINRKEKLLAPTELR